MRPYRTLAALLMWAFMAISCAEAGHEQSPELEPSGELVQAFVAVPSDPTRTEIEENGSVTRWSPEDKIALWASDATSQHLAATPFSLWRFSQEFPTAYFTAFIDPMPEGEYTYYGAYPVPVSSEGNIAYYDLPATQDGSAQIGNAVMVARPTVGGSLTSESIDPLHFDFVHKLHILKITIPESKNLLGEPLTRLDITFPTAVTGRLAVDVSNPDAEVTLSGGSELLSLNFSESVDAGDVIYAVIAPVDASRGMITFRAYSATRESQSIATLGKNFLPAHTTPIRLTIPDMRHITRIFFSVGDNYLGEEPTKITITAPSDTKFPDGRTSISFDVNEENIYEYVYEGLFEDKLSGESFTMSFESDHALVHQTFVMPQLVTDGRTNVPAIDVPYLLYEDFSGLNGSFENNTVHKTFNSGDPDAISLETYNLPDWYGARVGGGQGQNIRICSRVEIGLGAVARYDGRVDTPALSGIKDGASVKIKVEYDYAADKYEAVGAKDGYPVYSAGCSNSRVTKGSQTIEHVEISQTLTIDGPGVNGTYYGNTSHHASFTRDECGNSTRVSWYVTNNRGGKLGANGMYWLYIDNVKVSIAQ